MLFSPLHARLLKTPKISLQLLSSILISNLPIHSLPATVPSQPPKTKATIIDTTGSFPVPLLAKIIKSRILDSRSKTARQAMDNGNHAVVEDGVDAKEVEEEVRRCLEMVAISRVFDVEGLWEVLGEIGRDSESGVRDDEAMREATGVEMVIVDNMTHLINELFARKERSEGLPPLAVRISSLIPSDSHSTHPLDNPLPSPPHADTHAKHPHHPPQHDRIQHQ